MTFVLPFETEIKTLDDQVAALHETDPSYPEVQARLAACERRVYQAAGTRTRSPSLLR